MNILHIQSSSNRTNSVSAQYGQKVVHQIKSNTTETNVKERHTTYSNLPFVDDTILEALFVKGERTEEQVKALRPSQELVDEILWADALIISTPIYNFSVPASLKAYFDLVARAGLTFQYSENGPVGLLKNKKAYIVMSSGGTQIDSDIDFAGRYVKHFLGFIGITDVVVIKLDQLMMIADTKQQEAQAKIESL